MNSSKQVAEWTKPFHGVTHLGSLGQPRLTVTDRGAYAELHCWFLGCGFRPIETKHDTVGAAKAAGEKWLSTQGVRSTSAATGVTA